MQYLDRDDIQGLLLDGYGKLQFARFLLLEIPEGKAADARRWLGSLLEDITTWPVPVEGSTRVNVAFSYDGLVVLGLDSGAFDGVSREFVEGMTQGCKSKDDETHRQRILGDVKKANGNGMGNHPAGWIWGVTDEIARALLALPRLEYLGVIDSLQLSEELRRELFEAPRDIC